ncbi:transferrin-binding protein-like solute binding protein [Sphingomonas turrisvirgatae]|uniref:Transferrin-binding protein B C-lobe/N-lobe beta-barrel domain-containing protein n=1 Tax=Sphingomonas turrisvirgatae TaxID=1888892 RepID=A0A1E3LTL6_9SPHN|nr:transferrin-binding protein-like solute binding protein [Sphingomonas turrisvirgatae]ODP37054.1 hypothetical protein BFL28_19030 [Sphingomonas turrisvirgatae]
MRHWLMLSGAATLAACGGSTAPQSIGSSAPPAGSTPTPTATDAYSQFSKPVDAKTYVGIGGSQVYEYMTDERVAAGQQAQIYAGNAGMVRNTPISITYDPRDAIFTLTVADPRSGAAAGTRFQDPASRTAFGGAVEPQWGVPNLNALTGTSAAFNNPDIQYLQAGDGDPRSPYGRSGTGFIDPGTNTRPPDGDPGSSYVSTTLFYEKPGSKTKYVTFAGYVRNSVQFGVATVGGVAVKTNTWHLERGAFAYGAQTGNSAVPASGTGTYNGSMLATMVYNPTLDTVGGELPSYFQWLTGNSQLVVDFGSRKVDLTLNGAVLAPQIDRYTAPTSSFLPNGATFAAAASGLIDLAGKGGFAGSFGTWTFTSGGNTYVANVAGSSFDGAFFGPAAEEVGGGFRVVGGIPDQRIDILGAFTGKK